ncbi:PrpF domain-containing protein [Bosea sp. PAMC 26642]|uniref:PrpF domain-containing protein n=1 Tax=Bosea sp. (strain PAMC 26642) TaxID=1792307 RepID=UPI0007706361|nr:PrpF domain-containing protein [Bosea sp. PAMC 26642]AMJ62484.1 hypothetical protein AXW83_21215 [Bosea sp. PAMC 26642]
MTAAKITRKATPAIYMRGGTSKGVFFREDALPPAGPARDQFLLSVMGSPDRYGRQLNGLGGGISSVSKVIIVRRSEDDEADIEYLHGQVSVDSPLVDYSANCGNLSSAVGQFSLEAGLIEMPDKGEALIRMRNMNAGILVNSRFALQDAMPDYEGDFQMPGVSGGNWRVALEYLMPPRPLCRSGAPIENVMVAGRSVAISAADASLPCIFVAAHELGVAPASSPAEIDADAETARLLEVLRREGAVRMGLADDPAAAAQASPKIGIVNSPVDYIAIDGTPVSAGDYDIGIRMISMGKAHKAVPLTAAMCLAATALAPSTIPNALARIANAPEVRVGSPSGVLSVGAIVQQRQSVSYAERTIVYSTANKLMAGVVYGYV